MRGTGGGPASSDCLDGGQLDSKTAYESIVNTFKSSASFQVLVITDFLLFFG